MTEWTIIEPAFPGGGTPEILGTDGYSDMPTGMLNLVEVPVVQVEVGSIVPGTALVFMFNIALAP